MPGRHLHLGDGITGMLALAPGEAQLVLTDPPWGATKAIWDRPLDWRAWWAAIDHALAPTGTVAVFTSLRLALEIVPLASRPFAYDLIWKKNRPSGHLNAKRAPLRVHETVLIFGRGSYNPQFTYGHAPMNQATRISKSELYGRETITTTTAGATHRYQTSILDVASVANDSEGRIHSTQKPVDLLRLLVRSYSSPGDLVLDPTAGSGAVLHACRFEGRSCIAWESHPPMFEAASAWLEGRDSPLFAGPEAR